MWISNQTTLYLQSNRTEIEHSFGLSGLCPAGNFMFFGVEREPLFLSLFTSYICLLKLYLNKKLENTNFFLERVDSYKTFYEHLPIIIFTLKSRDKLKVELSII